MKADIPGNIPYDIAHQKFVGKEKCGGSGLMNPIVHRMILDGDNQHGIIYEII